MRYAEFVTVGVRPCLSQVCSALHQQYAEAGASVVRAFAAVLSAPPADSDRSVSRRRTVLRLLAQLLLAGVSSEWQLLTEVCVEPVWYITGLPNVVIVGRLRR